MPDDRENPSEDQEGNGQLPPQGTRHDEGAPSKGQESVERISQIYKTQYSEICLFEEAVEIRIFNERNYTVFISASLAAKTMRPGNYVFDTGTGPTLMREDFLESG